MTGVAVRQAPPARAAVSVTATRRPLGRPGAPRRWRRGAEAFSARGSPSRRKCQTRSGRSRRSARGSPSPCSTSTSRTHSPRASRASWVTSKKRISGSPADTLSRAPASGSGTPTSPWWPLEDQATGRSAGSEPPASRRTARGSTSRTVAGRSPPPASPAYAVGGRPRPRVLLVGSQPEGRQERDEEAQGPVGAPVRTKRCRRPQRGDGGDLARAAQTVLNPAKRLVRSEIDSSTPSAARADGRQRPEEVTTAQLERRSGRRSRVRGSSMVDRRVRGVPRAGRHREGSRSSPTPVSRMHSLEAEGASIPESTRKAGVGGGASVGLPPWPASPTLFGAHGGGAPDPGSGADVTEMAEEKLAAAGGGRSRGTTPGSTRSRRSRW